MAEIRSAAVDYAVSDDLISFLKAIPDGRYRRGVRYPQWFLLLVAVFGILSGCHSSRDLEAFAKRHREALNQALGLNFKRWPSDATFLYLYRCAEA
ncbi:transposase family protein [Synechococcus sp. CS-1328]|uniref:transposase family protein n=1 Tax=Synechococcus sp. CS-1328 TaxID=2847976 RepID=UPI00223AC3B4|nr:transposase family protein [Synechococcus sp. CS-1328]MCT0225625.1 transposase family protein [Synechococcus sp. CS-1328]